MSADGAWKITFNTPIGAQEVTATVTTHGDTFTGRTEAKMGSQEIAGQVDGDTLTWNMDITNPMPLRLDFAAKVEGDRMTGIVTLGPFGSAPLNGQRL